MDDSLRSSSTPWEVTNKLVLQPRTEVLSSTPQAGVATYLYIIRLNGRSSASESLSDGVVWSSSNDVAETSGVSRHCPAGAGCGAGTGGRGGRGGSCVPLLSGWFP